VKLEMALRPALEFGSLTARASLGDPDVRVEVPEGQPPVVGVEEGAVRVHLEFPDAECVRSFLDRVGRTPVPDHD
jgi:hypothetical protein